MAGMLDGKAAIITGAARGLGAAYAKAFAAEGASVCVSDVLDPMDTVNHIQGAGGTAGAAVMDAAE